MRITIKVCTVPAPGSVDDDIDFICRSLGFYSERDRHGTAGKIFRLLVKQSKQGSRGITSDALATVLNITRGAVVHHLNNFMEAGLVVRENNAYKIRGQSMQQLLQEIRSDTCKLLDDMGRVAQDIDQKLGNYYR